MKNVINTIEHDATEVKTFTFVFIKWIAISALIGIIGGAVGTLFYKSVLYANAIRAARPWLIYFLPFAGLAIVALYKITKTEGENTNDIIDSILQGNNVPIVLMPVIFIATTFTHLFGGSAGREGAALQIGGSIGCNVGKLLKLDEKEERIAILSGMSALFSALFGAPITATVFALEVCSVGIIHYSGLVPCGVSALVAYGITGLFGIGKTSFAVQTVTETAPMFLKIAVLAVLCAILSVIFCRSMHISNKLASKIIPNPYIKVIAGGVIIIGLTMLVGNQNYNGGGVEVIKTAIEGGQAEIPAFAWKILFTAITLSCGYKGGEIVPTFFIGSTFGCVIGPLLGIPSGFAAAIGLAATFCGAVNCPLASVILSVELFGGGNTVYFAEACFISYMLSGYTSLYEEQKIVYSKLKAEFINIKAE